MEALQIHLSFHSIHQKLPEVVVVVSSRFESHPPSLINTESGVGDLEGEPRVVVVIFFWAFPERKTGDE